MDEQREPKYLDLSASCSVSVTEMLRRFFTPVTKAGPEPGKEEQENERNG